MFKFVKERNVKNWPAIVSVSTDGGQVETHDITLDFKLLESDQFAAVAAKGDQAFCETVIIGWSGIADESGNELEFTEENLKALSLNVPFATGAYKAYLQASSGQASIKN